MSTLLTNSFVAESLRSVDRATYGELIGMSVYSREDYIRDCYGAVFEPASSGRSAVRFRAQTGAVLWSSEDDKFGTVSIAIMRMLPGDERYVGCKDFPVASESLHGSRFSLSSLYDNFDKAGFESRALPYLRKHLRSQAAKYDDAAALVVGLAPPSKCSAADRPKWGKFFAAASGIFYALRQEVVPPRVPTEEPTSVEGLEKLTFAQAACSWPDESYVAPMDGQTFQEWELKALEECEKARGQHGGHKPVIVSIVEGVQVAVKGTVDPFKYIGSHYIRFAVPDFSDDSERPVFQDAQAPTAPASPAGDAGAPRELVAGSVGAHFSVPDEFNEQREFVYEKAIVQGDLNAMLELVPLLKQGGPNPLGIEALSRVSKNRRAVLFSKFELGEKEFAQRVEEVREIFPPGASPQGVAWFVASKLVLARSNFQLDAREGRLYANRVR